jgi:hypothetical protein
MKKPQNTHVEATGIKPRTIFIQSFVPRRHIYVLVNLRHNKSGEMIEYFIVPSRVISEKMVYSKNKNSDRIRV